MRIAMWSGPRNLSTAMMYSFSRHTDCAVWDEPFYAAYLAKTGLEHPMRDEIINDGLSEASDVISSCLDTIPAGKKVFYQKHMTQHMVDGFDRSWLERVKNVFLIRHPARVIASYAAKREGPTLDDIGFQQQAELFDLTQSIGQEPIVIDSADIRENPERALTLLCNAIGLSFYPSMLSWPAGGNTSDGIWAAHWYGAVHQSTGFAGAEGPLPELSGDYAKLADQAMPYFEKLAPFAQKFRAV